MDLYGWSNKGKDMHVPSFFLLTIQTFSWIILVQNFLHSSFETESCYISQVGLTVVIVESAVTSIYICYAEDPLLIQRWDPEFFEQLSEALHERLQYRSARARQILNGRLDHLPHTSSIWIACQILLIFVNPSKCRQVFPEEVLDLPAIEIYRTICSKPLTFRELKRPKKTWRPSKNTECFEISLKCSLPCSCLGVTATSFFSGVALRGKIEMVKSIWKFVVSVVTVGTLICAGFSVR